MIYNGSYITSFDNKKPFNKEEKQKVYLVALISFSLFLPSVICQFLPLAIISGITFFFCIWLLLGNLLCIYRDKEAKKELEEIKDRYGDDWLSNPRYKGSKWNLGK